jgi:hypothetical protein
VRVRHSTTDAVLAVRYLHTDAMPPARCVDSLEHIVSQYHSLEQNELRLLATGYVAFLNDD